MWDLKNSCRFVTVTIYINIQTFIVITTHEILLNFYYNLLRKMAE